MEYAWSKKFLDFSILTVDFKEKTSDPIIYYYNPFVKGIIQNSFNPNTHIFPCKLNDVKGYPIKLSVAHIPPIMVLEKLNGTIKVKSSAYYQFIDFAITSMNFTTQFTDEMSDSSSVFSTVDILRKAIEKGDINLVGLPLSVKLLKLLKQCITVDWVHECSRIFAVVPVVPIVILEIPMEILSYIFIIPAIVLGLTYMMHVMEVMDDEWDVLNIMQLLMGIPTRMQSEKTGNRMIYLSVILISMNYGMNFYSMILDINYEIGEMPCNTYEDLDKSQFPIYLKDADYDFIYFNVSDVHLKNMMRKTHVIKGTKCDDAIKNGKYVICIVSHWRAEMYVSKYRKEDGSAIMKTSKVPFDCKKIAFFFELASPYAQRFADIQRRIHESGFWHTILNNDKKINTTANKNKILQGNGNFFWKELLIILSIGYLISVISLAAELLASNMNKLNTIRIMQYIKRKLHL